jgi:hypothetical protein
MFLHKKWWLFFDIINSCCRPLGGLVNGGRIHSKREMTNKKKKLIHEADSIYLYIKYDYN